jgi:hypothetical protein
LLQLIVLVSKGEYVPPTQVRSSLPKALDVVVAKAMSLDRLQRYATAEDMAHALSRLRQSLAPTLLDATVPSDTERPDPPQRGTLAMTPEPVSKTLGGPQISSWPRRSSVRLLVAIGLGVLGLLVTAIALGPSLVKSFRGTPEAGRLVEGQSSAAGLNIAQPSGTTSIQPIVYSSPIAAASVSPIASALLEPRYPLPAAVGSNQPYSAPRVYPPAATGKKAPGAAAPAGRADSYGLSKDNPFKSP